MAYPIGIDLGTTNSVVAVWQRGRVATLPVEGESTLLPSAISILPDGSVLTGRAARSKSLLDPASSVASAKRVIGDGKTEWQIQGKPYTPVDVSAMILKRLKEAAEEYLREPVAEAVVTVPAYFNNNQKRDTKLAAEQAGLKVLELLPEPTAAAVHYGLDKGKDQTLLVYDLGGGTFDVSVLRVKGNEFRVVAVDGDFRLGGDDFDLLLTEHLAGRMSGAKKSDLRALRSLIASLTSGESLARDGSVPHNVLLGYTQLREAAEGAKKELSESDQAQICLPSILGTSLEEEITLDAYNGLIAPMVERTTTKIKDVLASARLTARDIDRVILVGGSTRNRLVKERVTKAVKEPWISEHVDEAVAQGAAIVAAASATPTDDIAPIPVEFFNVTPFSLGVRASRSTDKDVFEALIRKNTTVPAAQEKEFTTFAPRQRSVDIAVFQGEDEHCTGNTFIGGFRLEGIPPAPAGEPKIVVRFGLDNCDLLTVTATCSHLRSEKTLDVNLVSREEELAKAARDVDIIFLIDTSGSMSCELDGVKASGLAFAEKVIEAGVGCRLGLMDFDLPFLSQTYKWETFGPMEPSAFPAAIKGLRIGRLGGMGCYIGNANTVPVIEAFVKSFPSEYRLKMGVLISDEVGNDSGAVRQIVSILQNAGVTLHVLGVSRSCHEALASETGGGFWDIQSSRGHADFSALLDSIAGEITNLALR
ncbi:MAG: hypothetical protein A2Y77_10095 [Planctomycetes bacterium RBG_13_62_9]|nr:MAG: hypothetical protein A2Y77_10095 [Planctomycetes bacterium RBG_13_62_9]